MGPMELTVMKALLRSPGGMETGQLAELTGMSNHNVGTRTGILDRKLADIGWAVKNIGCGGRGGALYVIKRRF